MRRAVSVIALVLLVPVAPLVPAASGLDAEAVQASDLDAVRANLLALTLDGPVEADFVLHAQRLRVETDRADVAVGAVQTQPRTTGEDHEDATVRGTGPGADALLVVVPVHASFEAGPVSCAELTAPDTDRFQSAPVLGGRPGVSIPLDDAVSWRPCRNAPAVVEGDFLVVLWDWNATVRSGTGQTDLPSGPGDTTTGDAGARERFLFATNATLHVPAGNGVVYLESPTATARTLHLTAADGTLQGASVSGDVDVYGDLLLNVRGNGPGQPLAVGVSGDVARALVDDTTIPAPGVLDGGPWTWLALTALALLLLYLRVRPHLVYWHNERTGGELGTLVPQNARQRRGVGLWILARAAERRDRFHLSHRRAGRAHDLFRPFPEAQFTRAVAAGRLGLHADAMTDFLDLYNRHDEPAGRAAAACGVAQECCRLRKWDAAREWLERAVFESPEYVRVAASDPEFDHFAGQAWFESLRSGHEAVGAPRGGADPSVH